MASPRQTNTTCDIYRASNSPPSSPDVAAVVCTLEAHYARGLETGEYATDAGLNFTHILWLEPGIDIRDGYAADATDLGNADHVYVPDKDGTQFIVTFVQDNFPGTPQAHQKVYLRRTQVTWPTNEL